MRFYLDTTEWIYHFEGNSKFGPAASTLIDRMDRGRHIAVSSIFVLSEILVIPRRNENEFGIAKLRHFFLSTAVTLAPYPLRAVDLYTMLRAVHRVKALDALHLAIAATATSTTSLPMTPNYISWCCRALGGFARQRRSNFRAASAVCVLYFVYLLVMDERLDFA